MYVDAQMRFSWLLTVNVYSLAGDLIGSRRRRRTSEFSQHP